MATTPTPEVNDPAAPSSTTGTTFLSANSQPGAATSGHATSASPTPVRPRVKVHMDADGTHYLLDPSSGTRYNVSDDEDVPLTTSRNAPGGSGRQQAPPTIPGASSTAGDTPSDASEITQSDLVDGPLRGIMGEDLLASLVEDILPVGDTMTGRQVGKFSALTGMLSMTRRSLLTTTGLVAGQRGNYRELAENVREFRDEVAERIEQLSDGIAEASTRLESTLEDNVRILRATGVTEAQLAQVVDALRQGKDDPFAAIAMPPLGAPLLATAADLGELRGPVNQALSPRQRNETADDFQRRGNATLERRARDTATFTPIEFRQETVPASILKNTRFVDTSSISSAGVQVRRGNNQGPVTLESSGYNQSLSGYAMSTPTTGPTLTVFEAFAAEKRQQIERMIDRQLGEAMDAPPRVPKLRDPPVYKGDDNDTEFFTWFGKLCTWLQGNALGGPKYDGYRILYLKSALDSHAIEWFTSEVEPSNRASDIPYEFEAIICALHRRFVTSATAVRATKEFEAVRYDPAQGIEALVSELIRTANKMREPPADITIRQRFMRLIPAPVHDELIRRGLLPEYADLGLLKTHARAWIEAQGSMRGSGGTSTSQTTRASPSPRLVGRGTTTRGRASNITPTPASNRGIIRAAVPPLSRPTNTADARPRTGPSTMAPSTNNTRTCYGCGLVGHIASDPICSRYGESASSRPRPAAQLHAQRVPASYSDGDAEYDAQDDPYEHEGLWGGDQYPADELLDDYPADDPTDHEEEITAEGPDPNDAPDLEDIFDHAQADEIRVGAMRRYFSMRVDPSEDVHPSEVGHGAPLAFPTPDSLTRSTILDLDELMADVAEGSYPLWTAAHERDCPRVQIAPQDEHMSHDELLAVFESHRGHGPYSGTAAVELAAIEAVGAEEMALQSWSGLLRIQPVVIMGYSQAMLRTTAVDVNTQNAVFVAHLDDLHQAITDVERLKQRRANAREYLYELEARPVGSQTSILAVVDLARTLNHNLVQDMDRNLAELVFRLEKMQRAKRLLEEELTRRMMEREALGPVPAPEIVEEVVPVIDLSPSPSPPPGEGHDWQSTEISSVSSVTPSPPPSYPGSPHDSDEYYLADGEPHDEYTAEMAAMRVIDSWSPPTAEETGDYTPRSDDEFDGVDEPQVLMSQRVELLSNVRRPRSHPTAGPGTIGLYDQPTRSGKTIACLSALIKIGDSMAYALFDSGSNTDSMTPEYANAIRGPRITLEEQVTLQLGCVGSRSKISYGTRVPVDFGGIRGQVYFDQVHLDRYEVVIGTPLMNRHGIVLDFSTREIRFPRGPTIKALSSLEEASLLATRKNEPKVAKRVD
ncbi:hypothetical protein C8R46DRAFT_1212417 [Mycena filopes]|nr:hypothetical protein C8R46DRAFT_1212417 [Mycena filopes]